MSAVSYVDALCHDYDYLFKVLLIGDSGVGKSTIVERYTEPKSDFDPSFVSTIGVDFKIRSFEWNGKIVKLQIWDTAGQERFRSITTSYYRGANGIILVHDLTDPQSLQNVERVWMGEIAKHASPDASILLVANKSDLSATQLPIVERSRAAAERMLDRYEPGRISASVETSAKTGANVEQAFLRLVDSMMVTLQSKTMLSVSKKRDHTRRLSDATPITDDAEQRSWCAC